MDEWDGMGNMYTKVHMYQVCTAPGTVKLKQNVGTLQLGDEKKG